ncbi:MAG: hypothetical protein ACOX5Z_11075 [Desulfobulbus sp.]|jgi:hypothetical protein
MTTPPKAPPRINPYVFPALLAGFGLWCLYDGWFNPDMIEHQLFNRIAAGVLLTWAVLDTLRTRKLERQHSQKQREMSATPSETAPPTDTP